MNEQREKVRKLLEAHFTLKPSLIQGVAGYVLVWGRQLCQPNSPVIQLPESPIPTLSQKASSGNISGTKRGIIDPLVSKRPEKILNKKIQKKKMSKMVKNGQKWSKMVKMVKMV